MSVFINAPATFEEKLDFSLAFFVTDWLVLSKKYTSWKYLIAMETLIQCVWIQLHEDAASVQLHFKMIQNILVHFKISF